MDGSLPPTGVRAASKAATRKAILEAAKACFEADGFAATTIRSIAAHAGLSTGAIFANFADKEELFTAATGYPAPVGALQDAAPDMLAALRAIPFPSTMGTAPEHYERFYNWVRSYAEPAIARAEGRS